MRCRIRLAPSLTFQLAIFPSVIVGDMAGITKLEAAHLAEPLVRPVPGMVSGTGASSGSVWERCLSISTSEALRMKLLGRMFGTLLHPRPSLWLFGARLERSGVAGGDDVVRCPYRLKALSSTRVPRGRFFVKREMLGNHGLRRLFEHQATEAADPRVSYMFLLPCSVQWLLLQNIRKIIQQLNLPNLIPISGFRDMIWEREARKRAIVTVCRLVKEATLQSCAIDRQQQHLLHR